MGGDRTSENIHRTVNVSGENEPPRLTVDLLRQGFAFHTDALREVRAVLLPLINTASQGAIWARSEASGAATGGEMREWMAQHTTQTAWALARLVSEVEYLTGQPYSWPEIGAEFENEVARLRAQNLNQTTTQQREEN